MPFITFLRLVNAQAPGYIQIQIHVMDMIGIFKNLKNIITDAKKNCAQMVMGLFYLMAKNTAWELQHLMVSIHNLGLWAQSVTAEGPYQTDNCTQLLQVCQKGARSAYMMILTTSQKVLYFPDPKQESRRIHIFMLMKSMKMNMEI